MAIEDDIIKAIKDGFAAQARAQKTGAGGKENLTVDVNITNEKLEESNERLRELREEISDYNEEIARAKAAGQDYIEIQNDLIEAQKDYNRELAETVDKEREAAAERKKQEQGLKDLKEGIVGLSSRVNEVQSLSRELQRTGAASAEVSRMAIRMGDQLRISGVEYEELTQATKSLVSGVTDFTMISKEQQKSLMKDAALFQEAGVSNETYSKAMQIGMKNMGLSADQASNGLRRLDIFARELQIPMNELVENFADQGEKLAQLGDNGTAAFMELARVSKITGLEMGKLISMTDKFDTFEGAAEQAGSLNAALGGNFVDSMSLMMEDDPAERFKMIRDAIDASGTAVEDMTRKQKMFIASAAGFENVQDFTAAMSGDLNALQKEMGDAQATPVADNLEKTARNLRSQTELIENAAKAATPAFGTLAAKAERFTDTMVDGVMDLADELQALNTQATQALPDSVAFGIGAAEGTLDVFDSIMEFLESFQSAIIGIMAFPGKIKGAFTKVKGFFGGMKTRIVDTFGWFTGKGKYKGNLNFFEKIQFKGMQAGEALKNLRTKAGNALKPLQTGFTKVANAGSRVGGALTKIGNIGKGIGPALRGVGSGLTRLGGGAVTAVASVGNMIFESGKGIKKALATQGSDMVDAIGAGIMGAGKGAAEAIDFLTFGLVDKVSSMTNSLGMGFNEAWEELDFAFIGETFEFAFDESIKGIKNLLGISSPSKIMMEIGGSMIAGLVEPIENAGAMLGKLAEALIDYFIAPFTTIGSLLMKVIQPALDMVPDSIKNLFMGDTADTANNLQNATTPAQAAAALGTADTTGGGAGQAQVINISLNMDGKEIDKKVINLIGGVVKEAVL